MKRRACCTPFFAPVPAGLWGARFHPAGYTPVAPPDPATAQRRARRQRNRLLGVGLLLTLGWMLGSLWLISARRAEHAAQALQEREAAVAALLAAKGEEPGH